MTTAQISGGFFNRVGDVLSNTDNLVEGIFWGSWCGLNIYNWTSAQNEKREAEKLPDSVEKTSKLWLANKNSILSYFSVVSGVSMVTAWLQDVKLISLGVAFPWINSFGFGGSSIVSFSKLWDSLCELDQGIDAFYKAGGPRERMNIALTQVETIIKIAFFASLAAWGAFGALHSLFGGAFLFFAMDTSMYYGLVFFLAYLASGISLSILKKTT